MEHYNQEFYQEKDGDINLNTLSLKSEKTVDRLKEITEHLEQGIKDMFESKEYINYLKIMSKFHRYSLKNTILISMQNPDASFVAGFSSWKNKFGRSVRKGEKGIKIIAPTPRKATKEVPKIDTVSKKPVIGTNGKPVTETIEVQIPSFKVVTVFDISQTTGKDLPKIGVDELKGNVEQYKDFFDILKEVSPVPIELEDMQTKAQGYYHLADKRIAVKKGLSELQTLKTTIHEIAHAKLHDIDLHSLKEKAKITKDARTREVEAESVAYTVCQYYGLDTSDYSFAYIAGWSKDKDLVELKSSLETIQGAATELISSIDEHFNKLQKSREKTANVDINNPEPTIKAPLEERLQKAKEKAKKENLNDSPTKVNNKNKSI